MIVLASPLTHSDLLQLGMRAKAQALIEAMAVFPQIECPLEHTFLPGLYIRTLHVPKDALTVGKIHKHPCFNMLSRGDRTTLIEDQMVRIRAPFSYWSGPGNQRVSYTHEDSVWITQHWNPRELRDIPTLEKELVAETEEDYQRFVDFLSMEAVTTCLS